MKTNGYILQESKNRVVIATMKSENEKTGDMVQITILNKNLNPVEARKTGKDKIVCGACPLSGGRGCYVNVGQAPLSIFKAYKNNRYSYDYNDFLNKIKGRLVRFGAYGDPSYINIDIVRDITKYAKGWTGYTHQWMNKDFNGEYLDYFQASIDNENQLSYLSVKYPKARYFRIVDTIDDLKLNEFVCDNELTGISCLECGKCNGRVGNFVVTKHGTHKNKINTK